MHELTPSLSLCLLHDLEKVYRNHRSNRRKHEENGALSSNSVGQRISEYSNQLDWIKKSQLSHLRGRNSEATVKAVIQLIANPRLPAALDA